MEWKGMKIPCMVEGTKGIRFSDEFTIRFTFKPDIIGGKQAIFSKRVPLSIGNRPGMSVILHGSCIELMTFPDGGTHWITARTLPRVVAVGQKYEVLVFRSGPLAQIYVNGFNRTNKKFQKCAPGSLNSDMEIIFGGQLYDTPELSEPFTGKIYSVEVYDQAYTSSASPLRYPKNPFAFPLKDLPEMKERYKLPIEIRR
jgi:hypothetical protein